MPGDYQPQIPILLYRFEERMQKASGNAENDAHALGLEVAQKYVDDPLRFTLRFLTRPRGEQFDDVQSGRELAHADESVE
jgi:hypothetical protein